MKIQELCMLAFITKSFLEGKAEINSVLEAWGDLGSSSFVLPACSPPVTGESSARSGRLRQSWQT